MIKLNKYKMALNYDINAKNKKIGQPHGIHAR